MNRICLVALWAVGFLAILCQGSPQSNYAERGLDVEYQGNGLPQEATLDGVVTKLDELSHTISTSRSTASLSCASRAMDIDLEFAEPFYGIVYADFSRSSACSLVGKGGTKYHFELPLTGCGTSQDPLRVFTNNIIVRFHPSLELEGDEVKTIVCRYPEPVVTPPLAPPLPISDLVKPPGDPIPERLGELQILMIICALLFLAMMLFGVACSYFCLKQRNIKLIRRRRALSSGPGSAITRMSDTTIFPPMFEGLKIPRAHASASNSGSEQLILESPPEASDTLPSDYPSESRSSSEIEEGDTRSFRRPSTISSLAAGRDEMEVDNHAYLPDDDERLSSVYSDAHAQFDVDTFGLPTVIPRVDPSFDVAFRVKDRHRSPAPSSATSVTSVESDHSRAQVLTSQERALTTILEREEWRSTEITRARAQMQTNPALNPPPDVREGPPPNYAEVRRKPRSVLSQRSIPENETWSVTEHEDIPDGRMPLTPARSLASLNTEMTDPHSVSELIMKSSRPAPVKPEATFRVTQDIQQRHETNRTLVINEDIQLHTSTFRNVTEDEETETMIIPTPERPIPPPKLTTQEVDDVFLKTITETRIIEEDERIRRQMLEYHQRPRPQPLPPNWDVTIRKHPPKPELRTPSESTNWDDQSQADPLPNPPNWDVKIRQYPPEYEPRTPSESTNWDGTSTIDPQPPPDWDVTIRQYPPVYEPRTPSESTNWDGTSTIDPQPPPDWDVTIRQYPPVYEPRTPSESTNWDGTSTVMTEANQPPPDWDVTIRQYPPVYEPRTPSESTNWDGTSTVMTEANQPPPDWDVSIRQYPPIYEPRTPSESTNWDGMSEPAPPPDWDVTIRQYPPVYEPREPSEGTDWDGMSQIDPRPVPAPPPPDWDVTIRQYPPIHSTREPSESTDWQSDVGSERPRSIFELDRLSSIQSVDDRTINWDVLIRVLNPPPEESDAASVLTIEDREKWAQIITTESTLRTMLTEAVVTEDFERIRRDTRFERIFEPKKWDVIIRVLAPPPPMDDHHSDTRSETTVNSEPPPRRFRRRPESTDSRSRRSSLAPVQEAEIQPRGLRPSGSTISERTNRSAEYDIRSITETTVNYAKYEPDAWSQSSGQTYQSNIYPRGGAYPEDWDQSDTESATRPSLARSTSEFTENWTSQQLPYDLASSASGYSNTSSSRRKPTLERSSTEVMEEVPRAMAGSDRSSDVNSMESSPRQGRRSRIPYERVSSSSGSESGSRPK